MARLWGFIQLSKFHRILRKRINGGSLRKLTEATGGRDLIRVMSLMFTVATDILVVHCNVILSVTFVSIKSLRKSDTTIGNNRAARCVRIF